MTQEIRLFVLESPSMFAGRVAARVCSQEGIRLLGRAKMHAQVSEQIQAISPDVLLMDTGLTVGENLPVLRQLREHYPRLPLVVAVRTGGRRGRGLFPGRCERLPPIRRLG